MDAQKQLEILADNAAELIGFEDWAHRLGKKKLKMKFGADPTRPDLHLGHAVVLRKLRQWQELGHVVQFVIGDFTALIGDPSGRNQTRPLLSPQEVLEHAQTYQNQVFKILRPDRTEVYFNSHWLRSLGTEGLIRLASHYTIARLLERDDFQKRFQQQSPIALHELIYPLLQGYDSVYLQSDVEIGGTDQKFNLLVGRELQKAYGLPPQMIILMPILEGTDGHRKMSKTYDNAIGLQDLPEEMFGKIMSIPDHLILSYYRLLTDVPRDKIQLMDSQMRQGGVNPRDLKLDLAWEIVAQFHSPSAAHQAREHFLRVYSRKELPADIPEYLWPAGNHSIIDVLVQLKWVSSKSEARRLIEQKALEMDQKVVHLNQLRFDLQPGQRLLVRLGKHRWGYLKGQEPHGND